MKKFIILILTALLIFGLCSCDPYADQFNKMQKEINSLKERVERNEESTASLLADISDSILSLEGDINRNARADKDELSARIDTLSQILEILEGNVDSNDSDRIAEIKLLKSELSALKSRVTDVEDRVTALEALVARVTALEEAIETKVNKGDFNNLVSDLTSLGEVLTDAVADIETLKANKADVSTLNTVVNNLEGLINTLESEVDSNNTTLTSAISDLKGSVETLRSRVTNVEDKVTTLEQIIARVTALEEAVNDINSDIDTLSDTTDASIKNLTSTITTLNTLLDTYYAEYKTSVGDAIVSDITRNLETLNSQFIAYVNVSSNANKDRVADIKILEEEIEALKTRVTSVEDRVSTLETISAKVSDIEALTIQLEEMIEFNEDIDFVVTTLASQLADLGDKLEGYYEDYKDNIEALDSEYALALLATNEDLEALEKVVDAIDTSLGNTDKEVTSLKRTLATTTTKVTNLSNELYAQGIKIDALEDAIERERYKLDTLLAEEGYHVIVDEITGEILEIKKHNLVHEGGTEECCTKVYCSECGYVETERLDHGWDTHPLVDNFTGKNIKIEEISKTAAGSYWVWNIPQFTYLYSSYCPECGYVRNIPTPEYKMCDFNCNTSYNVTFGNDECGYWGEGTITDDTLKVYKIEDRMTWTTIYVEGPSSLNGTNRIKGEVVAVEYSDRVWVAKDNNGNWFDSNHTLHLLNKTATNVEKKEDRYIISNLSSKLVAPEKVTNMAEEGTKIIIL